MRGFGADFKSLLRQPGGWRMGFQAYGEVLPYYENRVVLDPEVVYRWGCRCSASRSSATTTRWRCEKAWKSRPPKCWKPRAPSTVLNEWNQCHDVPNLFVTDGACMASSACQNPSLTYMALTARAPSYAIDQLKTGSL
ncbi:MAG: hypothetical protein ACI80V_000952 [Rhodothermales bacterium]|jgi:hypothetical protein